MKLYPSLIFREFKLSRGYYILFFLLFVFLCFIQMMVFFIPTADACGNVQEITPAVTLMSIAVPALGAFFITRDGGNYRKDVNTGWARYVYSLPVTARQRAGSSLLLRLCAASFCALMTVGFVAGIKAVTGVSTLVPLLGSFMIGMAAALLLIMLARDRKKLRKQIIVGNVVLIAAGWLFSAYVSAAKHYSGEFKLTKETMLRLCDKLHSGGFLAGSAAAAAIAALLYFIVLTVSFERREA